MRKLIIIVVFNFYTGIILGQSFFKYYKDNFNKRILDVIETDSSFLMVGYKVVDSLNLMKPVIYKVDKTTGNVLKLQEINLPYKESMGVKLIYDKPDFAVIGSVRDDSSYNYISYLKLNANFNLIDSNFIFLNKSNGINYLNCKLDNDSNIIVVGAYKNIFQHSFMYKLNYAGDSLNSYFFSNDTVRLITDLLIDSSNNYYLFSSYNLKEIFKFNSGFQLKNIYLNTTGASMVYTPYWMNDSVYICGSRYQFDKLYLYKADMNQHLYDSITFGKKGMYNYPAFFGCLDRNSNYNYYSGTSMINLGLYGNQRSYIFAVKTDNNLNVIWKKYYGYNAHYFVGKILATKDGGALITGSIDDINDGINKLDIFLLKLDSLGNTTWVRNIPVSKTGVSLYPNPATSSINISLEAQGESIAALSIYDNAGRTLYFSKPDKAKATIDIKRFASGVYFIKGRTSKGETFVRKFVKE